MNAQDIAAIKKDAADKQTEGGLDHAILRWLNYPADQIIRHAGGKVPGYLIPLVADVASLVIRKASKSRGKTTAKAK